MRTIHLLGVTLTFAVCGCGSDGGQPAAGDKKLSDLTPTEQSQFCATNADSFQALAAGSCTLGALDAPTKADCESARDECTNGGATSGTACDFSDCTAIRVSTAQNCIEQLKAFFASLTCDSAGQQAPTAPACLGQIEAGCPSLFGGT